MFVCLWGIKNLGGRPENDQCVRKQQFITLIDEFWEGVLDNDIPEAGSGPGFTVSKYTYSIDTLSSRNSCGCRWLFAGSCGGKFKFQITLSESVK